MAQRKITPDARDDAINASHVRKTPQTTNPSFRLAFQDPDFLLREDLRPVRFQLELLKPDLILKEAGIESTFVFYGSARIPSPEETTAIIAAAKDEESYGIAKRLADHSRYYNEARKLAQLASQIPQDEAGKRHFVVCSGGGPSIMEAANRGAADVDAPSIGFGIVLPFETAPNPYITPEFSFQFHYFALRKTHLMLRAQAFAIFPGGFGTLDEVFELLTLIHTKRIEPVPILFYGRAFWEKIVNFEALAEEGMISKKDLDFFQFVETAEEGWEIIRNFWKNDQTGRVHLTF
ncbi:MAG: LOG family protein [Zymomonas mobilis subsp. pomaceae]|uniref:AMP nucleosidase n=1 Tax=Zymomonas mobilis subsp. pomaceae (strain ATCC 29192 / DSM 22645 / JCM 10191 / CCUG 17912 / NBRC 13757 / NCIMB 11200 / NRRL B-4491 / Barker I) TaxID=579138 RepID=F8EVJ0_ZYMMT|nr:LOG family protein [Zymomonas mobilis]AEI38327.1 conserved hypothetical protein [Zymomonas mobilis subsp. pomaceae ATCC 29192]MDX5948016.1 LOG family protein [Zymomonas mobilis subsp. pomaceae]GEB89346.1 lysine decarboxylase [Zymomonas mobilis subsp. pomaceae]